MKEKKCLYCEEIRPLKEFEKKEICPGGYRNICLLCIRGETKIRVNEIKLASYVAEKILRKKGYLRTLDKISKAKYNK